MSRMLNVRIDADLWEAIEDAASKCGVTRSVWLREMLAAAVALPDPHPKNALMLQRANEPRRFVQGCKHPPTAIVMLPFSDVCRVCGQIVRNR